MGSVKISELPSASDLTGAVLPIVQGDTTKKASKAVLDAASVSAVSAAGVPKIGTPGYTTLEFAYGGNQILSNYWLNAVEYAHDVVAASGLGIMSSNTLTLSDTCDNDGSGEVYAGALFRHRVGGKGTKAALCSDMGVTVAYTAGTNHDLVSHLSSTFAEVNIGGDGGTVTTDPDAHYKGNLFASNDHVRLANGAIYWRLVVGNEINCEIETGASSYARVGFGVFTGSNGTVQAVEDDVAVAIANKDDAGVAWKTGIAFGLSWGGWPFNSSSTLIGASKRVYPSPQDTITADKGVDFTAVTFSTSAFSSPGFNVDPDGDTTVKSLTIGAATFDEAVGAALVPQLALPITQRWHYGVGPYQRVTEASLITPINPDQLWFVPTYIPACVIDAVAINVVTADSGKGLKLALYEVNPITGLIAGSPIWDNVASPISLTNAGVQTQTGLSIQIKKPGLYMFACKTNSLAVAKIVGMVDIATWNLLGMNDIDTEGNFAYATELYTSEFGSSPALSYTGNLIKPLIGWRAS